MTPSISITRTPRRAPVPRPNTPPPTAAMCPMCAGQGGHYETSDGQTPGKGIQRWVPCTGCKGTGKV